MSSKQKTTPHKSENPKSLKVGSRVRCTDDGVEGRITWANATVLKIQWDDGEQVTWRRDSLAERPLEILDPPADEPAAQSDEPVQAPVPQPSTEQAAAESPPPEDMEPPTGEQTPTEPVPAPEPPVADQAPAATALESSTVTQPQVDESAKGQAKPQQKEPKAKGSAKEKKLSAIDAAAQVLSRASAPMSCQELIAAMAAQGLWSSPAGKTPAATLYSALLREVQVKGDQARFVKAERGKFALRDHGAQL
jgi:hypothetical protein